MEPPALEDRPGPDGAKPLVPEGVARRIGLEIQHQQMSGPPWLALADKITSDHITTMLEHSSESQEIELEKSKGARWERIVYVGIGTILLVLLTILVLPQHPEMYVRILEWAGLFSAGGLGGYGIGVRRSNRSE